MGVAKSLVTAILCTSLLVAACVNQGAPAAHADADLLRPLVVSEYHLGPGDEVSISVFGRPELTGTFPISSAGTIAFPLAGEIQAADLTPQQFTSALENRLRPDIVRDPKVSAAVIKYRPFFILGEVGDAGIYPFTPGLTVMSAVATAGGFSYRANSRRVFIRHAGETQEKEYPLTSTTPVQPGDTVRIPQRRF